MNTVYVWDKFIRFFHWSLVVLFIVSYITADELESVHVLSGYSITALLFTRLVWGFVGSKYARFSEFVRTPKTVFSYLRQVVTGQPKRYLGHNPAGGAMVVAILFTLGMTVFSGMKLLAVEEGEGPFAQQGSSSLISSALADDDDHEYSRGENGEEEDEFWEETHEFFVNLMLMFIVVHVLGVFMASKQHNELLVKSMINGKKRAE